MGWLKNALGFEVSRTKDIFKGIKKDPKRLLLGVDGPSTALWNGILGREDEPIVGVLGAPTEQNYQNAEARGIDTGAGRTTNAAAQTIAALYATGGLGGAGGAGAGGAAGGAGASGANWAQYAGLARGASGLMQPSQPAPVGSPPINNGPRSGVQVSNTGMPNSGPGPVMQTPQQRRMLAQILRSGGRMG
jgi:hypothetical protein